MRWGQTGGTIVNSYDLPSVQPLEHVAEVVLLPFPVTAAPEGTGPFYCCNQQKGNAKKQKKGKCLKAAWLTVPMRDGFAAASPPTLHSRLLTAHLEGRNSALPERLINHA